MTTFRRPTRVAIGFLAAIIVTSIGAFVMTRVRRHGAIKNGPAAYKYTVFEVHTRKSSASGMPVVSAAFLGQVVEATGILERNRAGSFNLIARKEIVLKGGGHYPPTMYAHTSVPMESWPLEGSVVTVRGFGEYDVKGQWFLSDAVFAR
jgi:hypothetical protein